MSKKNANVKNFVTIAGHGWKSTWNNTTRKTVDSKALEKAFPEIYNEFSKVTHSTRFTLNKIKTA